MISNKVIQFIRKNIQLIDDEKFEELYKSCEDDMQFLTKDIGEMTQVLLDSGINPISKLTKIPDRFLGYTMSIKSFIVPDIITSIGRWAFYNSNLENITIPDTVKLVGKYAFSYCPISEISLPGVEKIEETAFSSCYKLKIVSFSDSIQKLGRKSFSSCKDLRTINYMGTVEQWKKVQKYSEWNLYTHDITVHCSDGDIHIY